MATDLGDVLPLTVEVRDAAGNLANAGAVTLTIGLPDGTSATPAVTNPSVGRYQCDYQPPQPGRYTARWVASGLNSSAYVDEFDVRPADPGYILSLSTAKAALNMSSSSTADDEELRSLIEAVTRVIEDYRGEVIARRTVTEKITPSSWRRLLLSYVPVISVTSVTRAVDGFTWSPTDLTIADPAVGYVDAALTAPAFYGELTVTYVAGQAIVPANYTEAAKIIVQHLWQTQRMPNLGPPTPFSEGTTLTPSGLGFAVPNRAVELLGGRQPLVG